MWPLCAYACAEWLASAPSWPARAVAQGLNVQIEAAQAFQHRAPRLACIEHGGVLLWLPEPIADNRALGIDYRLFGAHALELLGSRLQ
jgi:hypothetical protein